jgi:hypothetical protein
MTFVQVAERAGIDTEQLAMLEGSNYLRATLGALRAYFIALEPVSGWTLAETGNPSSLPLRRAQERAEMAPSSDQPVVLTGSEAKVIVDLSERSSIPNETPWVPVERGMTVLGYRRSRGRRPEGELDNPTVGMRKDGSYAGV